MNKLVVLLIAGSLALTFTGQAFAQACPDDANDADAKASTYLGKTKRQAFDHLFDVYGACESANEIKTSDAAARTYSGLPVNQATTIVGYVQSLQNLATLAQDDVSSLCQKDGPACEYARAISQRAVRVYASADALAGAYGAKGTNSLPARTIKADETNFEVSPQEMGVDLFDIVLGMRRGQMANDPEPEFGLVSICAFVFSGKLSGSDCGATNGLAALEASPCDAACADRAAQAALTFRRLLATTLLYRGGAMGETSLKYENEQNVLSASKWRAYWFGGGEGRVQWPWEIYVNGASYNAETDTDGRFIPPTHAWTILHPGVGASLYDTDGAKLEVAAIVELVGYSTWKYDDKTGERRDEWGGSVIAAYAQSDTADDWGYGLLLRTPYKGLNVSWTRRDSPTGAQDALLFSLNLNDLARSFLDPQKLCSSFNVSVPGVCSK